MNIDSHFDTQPWDHLKYFQEPLVDAGLHVAFESAVLDSTPNYYYNNISIGFKMFIMIFKILPTKYADKLSLYIWGKSVGYDLIK